MAANKKAALKMANDEIARFEKIKVLINTLESGKTYLITRRYSVYDPKTRKSHEVDASIVCKLDKFNKVSIRVKFLATDQPTWEVRKAVENDRDCFDRIPYDAILTYKEYDPDPAELPLMINWFYVSPEFKSTYFGGNSGH